MENKSKTSELKNTKKTTGNRLSMTYGLSNYRDKSTEMLFVMDIRLDNLFLIQFSFTSHVAYHNNLCRCFPLNSRNKIEKFFIFYFFQPRITVYFYTFFNLHLHCFRRYIFKNTHLYSVCYTFNNINHKKNIKFTINQKSLI